MTFEELKKDELEDTIKCYVDDMEKYRLGISFEQYCNDYVKRCAICEKCFITSIENDTDFCDNCKNQCNIEEFHYMHPEEDMMTRWDECE